jgi:hypothetical protein
MSVPQGQRSESKLEVFVKARELAAYTITICRNEKKFDPTFDFFTHELTSGALGIARDVWSANNVKVVNEDDLRTRLALQERAARRCNDLLSDMQIAQRVFHLETRRIRHWGGMAADTRNLIRKWRESDASRYRHL